MNRYELFYVFKEQLHLKSYEFCVLCSAFWNPVQWAESKKTGHPAVF